MKNEPIHYLGLDVHQSTSVACVRDEQGSVRMRATVPTEEKAILQLAASAGRRVHVAFEEGTQAQWLHDVLVERVERVVVFNARGRGGRTTRTTIDTESAAEGLRTGALKPVFHGAPEMLTLRELLRSHENLVRSITRVASGSRPCSARAGSPHRACRCIARRSARRGWRSWTAELVCVRRRC
jgi:hypothetical protein